MKGLADGIKFGLDFLMENVVGWIGNSMGLG